MFEISNLQNTFVDLVYHSTGAWYLFTTRPFKVQIRISRLFAFGTQQNQNVEKSTYRDIGNC